MKKLKKLMIMALAVAMSMFFIEPIVIYAETNEYIVADFHSDFVGDVRLKIKRGFDFIETSSESGFNNGNVDMALTALVLSNRVYNDGEAEIVLSELGYEQITRVEQKEDLINGLYSPEVCFGYKGVADEQGNNRNVFAVVVRGTLDGTDIMTDLWDGFADMFAASTLQTEKKLQKYITSVTGKSITELKKEDNYFFITGHSLGGAVANNLSTYGTVTDLTGQDKNKVYTYTFESPHTCYVWEENTSHSVNYKNDKDAITQVPWHIASSTRGNNIIFEPSDINDEIFNKLFPKAWGDNIFESAIQSLSATLGVGHHDLCWNLAYILQKGTETGQWSGVDDVLVDGTDAGNIFSKIQGEFFARGEKWSTLLTIAKDGSFTGEYHHNGYTDDGSGNYVPSLEKSVFQGKFENAIVVDKNSYYFELKELTYTEGQPGERHSEEIDGVETLVIYEEAPGLSGEESFYLYKQGTSLDEVLGADYVSQLFDFSGYRTLWDGETLPCWTISSANGGSFVKSLTESQEEETANLSEAAEEKTNAVDPETIIGTWATSDGTVLTFGTDGAYKLTWGFGISENGTYSVGASQGSSFTIDMDGGSILEMMSLLYGAADYDYHFEILVTDDDHIALAQVYGDYTAETSPCKLSFTRQ